MFIHSVYFWLAPASSVQLQEEFVSALRGLLAITDIAQGYIGPPAATRDEVIEHGYSYALTLLFVDQAAHDRYQVHPSHVAFVSHFTPHFAKVQVFDSEAI